MRHWVLMMRSDIILRTNFEAFERRVRPRGMGESAQSRFNSYSWIERKDPWFCYTRALTRALLRADPHRHSWNYANACDTVRSVARSVVRSPSRSAVRSFARRGRGRGLGVMGIRYQSRVRRCLSETCTECLAIGTRSSRSSSLVVAERLYPNAERNRGKRIQGKWKLI